MQSKTAISTEYLVKKQFSIVSKKFVMNDLKIRKVAN